MGCTVSLQSYFSRKINLTIKTNSMGGTQSWLLVLSCLWFITLKYISLVSAYIYLVIFTVIEVYAFNHDGKFISKFDNGTNRGVYLWFITILLLSSQQLSS